MENNTPHNFELYSNESKTPKGFGNVYSSAKEFFAFIKGDGAKLILAFLMVILNSAAGVVTPLLIARAVDKYISTGDIAGLGYLLIVLGLIYILTVITGYTQGRLMGGVSQRTLFRLREALFLKLQELPIAFFNQNKAGDLMSRLNNDTDKLNQFLSESITRFVGNFFVLLGIAIFVLYIHFTLGLVMLSATVVLIAITQILSPWIERRNRKNLEAVGHFSAALQENLSNFRVIVAYHKREYLRGHLMEANKNTFSTSLFSNTANRVFEPIYDFAGSMALVAVLWYGLHLVTVGSLTIGMLVAFVSYTQRFYDPLRILATIFGTIQLSVAAWSRIRAVFSMKNNLVVLPEEKALKKGNARMELDDVSFGYEKNSMVIEHASLTFEAGKTYALVGPTGGGKSTLASLMARLYDPISGVIYLNGKDIRSYTTELKSKAISVILQEPILFSGTVGLNIKYGNDDLKDMSDEELMKLLTDKGFADVIARFPNGLSTTIDSSGGSGLSLGQKQLISFMRALLRAPQLLILDEATANIDTVTESILNQTLLALPQDTTKVIIAHRLNTIKDADEIMFVNGHHVTRAGDFREAIELIEHSKRTS